MREVFTLAFKDLRLLARDPLAMFFSFGFPLVYGIFFGAIGGAMSSDGPSMRVAIVDEDGSEVSRRFIKNFDGLAGIEASTQPRPAAVDQVRRGKSAAYVVIPKGFGETAGFFWGEPPQLELGVDPAHKAESGMVQGLLVQALVGIMRDRFNDPAAMRAQVNKSIGEIEKSEEIPAPQWTVLTGLMRSLDQFFGQVDPTMYKSGASMEPAKFNVVEVSGRNSEQEALLEKVRSPYEISFPSAILWGVMGCVAGFAVSLVNERIEGTFLRLKIAPLTVLQVLAGKAAACFLSVVTVILVTLLFGRLVFGVRLPNPLGLLLAACSTATCFVGLMMLLSTIGKTPGAVAGAGWAAITVMAMLGGGMIPLLFMPPFLQKLSHFSPVKWAILSLEGATWRGFSFGELLVPCAILVGIGGVSFAAGTRLLARS